jgi:hypothetical protein
MTIARARLSFSGSSQHRPAAGQGKPNLAYRSVKIAFLAAAFLLLLAAPAFAQSISGVDPSSGKAEDTVTVSGANLEKDSVSAVYLSDDKTDYKATIVSQAGDKIVIKIPRVKAGVYNVSILAGKQIMIQPVRFTVAE